MAAADKARYYLERTVPDLQELVRKEVFSEAEITSIVKKRSDFEHILNGPGSKAGDYIRYVAYEMNLDALRKKRCQRLGVKSTAYNGQRTVFFILDRATKKFPGDKSLWLQYIQFCQKEKANKKLARAFTAALRLRPRDVGLWIMAAKHYAEAQGDMPTARGYLQRGLRFCADERQLYIQYAKLEMIYLAKLSARRRVLGLDAPIKSLEIVDDDNTISLPAVTAEDFASDDTAGLEHVNEDMLKRLANAPVLQGAVPVAIFESAMKQFHSSPELAVEFFEMTLEFDNVDAIAKIRQHILSYLETSASSSTELIACTAKIELLDVATHSAAFPAALGACLAVIRRGSKTISEAQRQKLAEKTILMLLPHFRQQGGLDEGVIQVLSSTVKSNLRRLDGNLSDRLMKRLRKQHRNEDVDALQTLLDSSGGG